MLLKCKAVIDFKKPSLYTGFVLTSSEHRGRFDIVLQSLLSAFNVAEQTLFGSCMVSHQEVPYIERLLLQFVVQVDIFNLLNLGERKKNILNFLQKASPDLV